MKLDQITPDIVLASLLDGNVEVQTSATAKRSIKCYAAGMQPNKGVADEFLSVLWNGSARARASQMGCMRGNLALTVHCKLQSNNVVKTQRVRQMLSQCQMLANGISSQGFFFKIDPYQVITPTTANLTTGYSTTVINVEWRES